MEKSLPSIPAKRYFTIGEVSELCGVKPHVLRYWEQEFTQLRPMKRRGNRRYYQHHEVLMIRRIRDLLYDQGFTISGARNKLQEIVQTERDRRRAGEVLLEGVEPIELPEGVADEGEVDEGGGVDGDLPAHAFADPAARLPQAAASAEPPRARVAVEAPLAGDDAAWLRLSQFRRELAEIRDMLSVALDRGEGSRDSRAII